jgi:putative SOS response-associated peptidase YedK
VSQRRAAIYRRVSTDRQTVESQRLELEAAARSGESQCDPIPSSPNELCALVHNRMPAILAREKYVAWLDETEAASEELKALLKACASQAMEAVKVSTKVNNVKNKGTGILAKTRSHSRNDGRIYL